MPSSPPSTPTMPLGPHQGPHQGQARRNSGLANPASAVKDLGGENVRWRRGQSRVQGHRLFSYPRFLRSRANARRDVRGPRTMKTRELPRVASVQRVPEEPSRAAGHENMSAVFVVPHGHTSGRVPRCPTRGAAARRFSSQKLTKLTGRGGCARNPGSLYCGRLPQSRFSVKFQHGARTKQRQSEARA